MSEIINEKNYDTMPVLPLRGLTLFPKMSLHFDVGRDKSLRSLEHAMSENQLMYLVAQREIGTDDPDVNDVYDIGTVARIEQILKFPGDNMRVLVRGLYRARIDVTTSIQPYFEAQVVRVESLKIRESELRCEALIRSTRELFGQYIQYAPKMTHEVEINVLSTSDVGELADYIAQNLATPFTNKQAILEEIRPFHRLELVNRLLSRELEICRLESDIASNVREQIDKNQRDYFLHEQLKAIQSELGEEEDTASEVDEYIAKISRLNLSDEANEKLLSEAKRLSKMQYNSPESSVIRTYLDTCINLPWNKKTRDKIDVAKARRVLDSEHFGMEKVKERILEFIAVKKLAPDIKGQILCLVGPPGVGKTSIGQSIAKALGRRHAHLSLGGVRDEADIRGHRKTYIGAMPGRIMTALANAGSKNAMIMLDEIDKMSADFRGDPTAAMLELLDSEQNYAFRDHYIEIPFDLSEVLFITTANTTETIPRPLLDRMEVIELSSYTTEEKFSIAKLHLIKKQMKRHGLTSKMLKIRDSAIYKIIEGYTREAGVRELERTIATLCRKVAKAIVSDENSGCVSVSDVNLQSFLGAPRYSEEHARAQLEPGVVNGLAWTAVGGAILEVEVNIVDGTGKIEITGNLGTVMNESAKAALTYVRSRADAFGIKHDFYKKNDVHIHFPEGAIPKDGPSAGVTIATAIVSALTGVAARATVAMTGEVSIRGRVLPIGGLKEKAMAAYRAGIKTIIIPHENVKDLEELDPIVRAGIEFISVQHVDEVIANAIPLQKETSDTAYSAVIPTAGKNRGIQSIRQ